MTALVFRYLSYLRVSQTASLLTFVTYFLAMYPSITRKLRAEVSEHCGPGDTLTYEKIRNLKYSARPESHIARC
jgi:hypothetical protein